MTIADIQKPLKETLLILNQKLREATKSNISLLNLITKYIIKSKGKQIRPTVVFLTAQLIDTIQPKTYTAATMIELLHTATLVHDDVVDDSNMRRGFFSINAIWKNKIAVLIGDFLLSKGLLVALETKNYDLLELVSESVKEMSEGELLQIEKARKLNITEAVYYDIINKKTASLLKVACALGVASVSENQELIEKAKLLGTYMGMAFQIKDDLFEYGDYQTGKTKGVDIKEQKLTLPLIYTLNQVDFIEKEKIKFIIKFQNTNKEKVNYVIQKVIETGGISYAEKVMNDYANKAREVLSYFKESDAKTSLDALITFTIHRKN
jgi:octaprenyl-diphosphate synthase